MNQPLPALSSTDLNALARKFTDVQHVIQVSRDGLLMVATDNMRSDVADSLSAAVTGVGHLCDGVAKVLAKPRTQSIAVDFGDALLLIMAAGTSSLLAVLASGDADLEVIGGELATLASCLTPAAGMPA